jgi:hypothetical protein
MNFNKEYIYMNKNYDLNTVLLLPVAPVAQRVI